MYRGKTSSRADPVENEPAFTLAVIGLLIAIATVAAISTALACGPGAIDSPLASRSLLLDAEPLGDRIIAVGERGHILISESGGASWRQAPSPTRATLTAVEFIDAENGLAVGHDGIILSSDNGGESWRCLRFAPNEEAPLFDLHLQQESDDRPGFQFLVVGAFGTLLMGQVSDSEQGHSAEWQPVPLDYDPHLYAIVAAEDGALWLLGEAGALFRRAAGDSKWRELRVPMMVSLFGGAPLGGEQVLVFGQEGRLFVCDPRDCREVEPASKAALLVSTRREGRIVIGDAQGQIFSAERVSGSGFRFSPLVSSDPRGVTALLGYHDRVIAFGFSGATVLKIREE